MAGRGIAALAGRDEDHRFFRAAQIDEHGDVWPRLDAVPSRPSADTRVSRKEFLILRQGDVLNDLQTCSGKFSLLFIKTSKYAPLASFHAGAEFGHVVTTLLHSVSDFRKHLINNVGGFTDGDA